MLRKFWFEFEIDSAFNFPPGIGLGCGITTYDYNDALKMMDEKIFHSIKRPPFKKVIQDVEISMLDEGHVIPNMKNFNFHGIWFPLGYDNFHDIR